MRRRGSRPLASSDDASRARLRHVFPESPGPVPKYLGPTRSSIRLRFTARTAAACHGADGAYGPAMGLSDHVYLAIVDNTVLQSTIANGRPGTAMPAFAQKQGGMLTDEQIESIVRGIRERWGGSPRLGATPPPYESTVRGDAPRGEAVYATFCASCHGSKGQPGPKAGSVTDPAYLSLISDQGLRTLVITGRPDFGAPDWRGNVPGRPMTDQDVSDVVAWLSSQRPASAADIEAANIVPGGGR